LFRDTILEVKNLNIVFETDEERKCAVDDISFSLRKGETLGVVGESGSGKSTTALAIMKLIPAPPGRIQSGEIWFYGKGGKVNLAAASENAMRSIRGGRIAMIFQEPMTFLNPVFRCGEQVMEAIVEHESMPAPMAHQRVVELFQEVSLPNPEEFVFRYPHQLSGGQRQRQRQRVLIAMALAGNPEILIADEPTSALDVTVQRSILDLLNDLQIKRGMSILFISHDLGVIAEVADSVAVMYRGKIVEWGSVWDIFAHPKHPYTKGLLACRSPVQKRLTYLPTVSDFMEVREDTDGRWTITEKTQATVEEMIQKWEEPREIYLHGVESLLEQGPLLSARHLKTYFPPRWKLFGRSKGWTKAVDDVSFDVYPGETLGLVGESGSGKTTLARTILRLIETKEGEILFMGKDLLRLPKEELRRLRRHFQIIFQDPYSSLNPRMALAETLLEPLEIHGLPPSRSKRVSRVLETLERVGLPTSYLSRYPHEFSGGERQRIAIARALVLQPDLLILDEAVSALDVSVQARILNLLNRLKREMRLTYIFISHDLALVKFMSERIAVMKEGHIVEIGPAEEVFRNPQSPYTRELSAAVLKGTLEDIERQQARRGRLSEAR
jgi:peptide/nickel transport system ATP-binding protein